MSKLFHGLLLLSLSISLSLYISIVLSLSLSVFRIIHPPSCLVSYVKSADPSGRRVGNNLTFPASTIVSTSVPVSGGPPPPLYLILFTPAPREERRFLQMYNYYVF